MKKNVITGLVFLLPLTLTIWIISSIVDLLTGPFIGIAKQVLYFLNLSSTPLFFLSAEEVLSVVSKILVLLFLFIFISMIGAIGRHMMIRSIFRLGDSLLHRIPVISSVYKTSQELISTILTSDNRAFKQVVLVPFPHEQCLSVGLVAKEDPSMPHLIPVFVPTTPNPTSGYLIMYERDRVIPINMTIEEAFRYIVSCGMLTTNTQFQTFPQKGPEEVTNG